MTSRSQLPGGVGGASNEQGSSHRTGVAAFIMVCGLRGDRLPLRGLTAEDVPQSVALETDDPIDDISVTLSGGSQIFIQAKRRLEFGKSLQTTVEQWVRIAPSLQKSDLVCACYRSASKTVFALDSALRKCVSQSGTRLLKNEADALQRFEAYIESESSNQGRVLLDPERRRLYSAIRFWRFEAEETEDTGWELALAKLDGAVVKPGQAAQAWSALRSAARHQARNRTGSCRRDWMHTLRGSPVELLADRDGVISAREEWSNSILAEYRRRVVTEYSTITILTLGPAPITIPIADIDAEVLVAAPGRISLPVDWATRRRGHSVIVGMPGSGKSTLLRKVATSMAADTAAPVPLLVDLRRVQALASRQFLQDAIIAASCESIWPGNDDVQCVLKAEMASGRVALLLDGLDECGPQRVRLAGDLSRFLRFADVPEFVLTAREVDHALAGSFNLPILNVQPPKDTTRLVKGLVKHLVETGEDPELRAESDRRTNDLEQLDGGGSSMSGRMWSGGRPAITPSRHMQPTSSRTVSRHYTSTWSTPPLGVLR